MHRFTSWMKSRRMFSPVLGLCLSLMLPWPRAIADSQQQVPFKGSVSAQFVFMPTEDPSTFIVGYTGTGEATHLGRFTVTAEYTVTEDYIEEFLEHYEELEGVNFSFTAANGDTLFGDYSGYTVPIGPGLVFFHAEAVFMGGTGRFEGATGSYTTEGIVDVMAGQVSSSFDGTVSPPGAAGH